LKLPPPVERLLFGGGFDAILILGILMNDAAGSYSFFSETDS